MNLELIQEKWDDILQSFKEEHSISDISFKSWLLPLEPTSIEDDTLIVVFDPKDDQESDPDQMAINYITKKYAKFLAIMISEVCGFTKEVKLRFALPGEFSTPAINETFIPKSANYATSNLNAKYTFDTFVVGGNNKFARQASLAVSESPGEAYNPLYIYGGPGLGKTHLLHSIGNFIINENPDKKVLYVTSEQFLNEVIEGIRGSNSSNAITKTREKYRSVDILLIDDIQILIGKESTQQEFFNTFNTLYLAGKQIVITSDKPPKEMETLEERIRSRFESGLMADIGNPDYETRMAILRKKVESEKINLSDVILD